MTGGVEVRCPECRRFIVEVPPGTPVRVRCRDCSLTFERLAQAPRTVSLERVRVRVMGVS